MMSELSTYHGSLHDAELKMMERKDRSRRSPTLTLAIKRREKLRVKYRGLGPAANSFGTIADHLAASRHPTLKDKFLQVLIRHHLICCQQCRGRYTRFALEVSRILKYGDILCTLHTTTSRKSRFASFMALFAGSSLETLCTLGHDATSRQP
jgi:hypothetical protein